MLINNLRLSPVFPAATIVESVFDAMALPHRWIQAKTASIKTP